jgi:hypothetical protein
MVCSANAKKCFPFNYDKMCKPMRSLEDILKCPNFFVTNAELAEPELTTEPCHY